MDVFIPDIETDFPLEITQGNFGDEFNLEFRLGVLVQAQQVVLRSTTLLEGHSFLEGRKGIFDLRFGIRLAYMDRPWNVTAMDYNQATKRRYIHTNNRQTVRDLLLRSVTEIVKHARPQQITMSTYDAELPDAALVKYRLIEARLNEVGYETRSAYRSGDLRDRWYFAVAT